LGLRERFGVGEKVSTRQAGLAVALVLAGAYYAYQTFSSAGPHPGSSGPRGGRSGTSGTDLPRIDLARLDSPTRPSSAGRRDLFEFGFAEPEKGDEDDLPVEPPPSKPTPSPVVANPGLAPPVAPRLVAINLKYIGSLEAQGGPKVAVLLTDRNEILYGQVGQQVANRFKILRIGFESVEVLDEGSGQSRRIPLKGN
jgi:hypothetical protein